MFNCLNPCSSRVYERRMTTAVSTTPGLAWVGASIDTPNSKLCARWASSGLGSVVASSGGAFVSHYASWQESNEDLH
jgi:hypothetical protein